MNDESIRSFMKGRRPVAIAAAAALAMLAIFLLVQTADAIARFGQGDQPQINTITVSGTGTSSATPDIATISFSVQEQASTVAAAQDAATKKANAALAALKDFSIADKDVKTTGYTVSPQYATEQTPCAPGMYCPAVVRTTNTITGYQVMESIDVTVRDTSKAGDIVTKLGTLGVQNISGPNFTIDDDNGVMNDARAMAIENAHDKAVELAKELGVSLGSVVSYSDQGGVYPTPMYDRAAGTAMSAAATPNLPVGTQDRTVNVQVTYRIH
jgi:uncharacterized protein YggE